MNEGSKYMLWGAFTLAFCGFAIAAFGFSVGNGRTALFALITIGIAVVLTGAIIRFAPNPEKRNLQHPEPPVQSRKDALQAFAKRQKR